MITLTKVWQDPFSMLTEKVHSFIKKGQTLNDGIIFELASCAKGLKIEGCGCVSSISCFRLD